MVRRDPEELYFEDPRGCAILQRAKGPSERLWRRPAGLHGIAVENLEGVVVRVVWRGLKR